MDSSPETLVDHCVVSVKANVMPDGTVDAPQRQSGEIEHRLKELNSFIGPDTEDKELRSNKVR